MVKTHGRRGEVVTVPVHGLPPMLREGMEVALVPPAVPDDRWQVVEFADDGETGQLVGFVDVTTISEADALVGRLVLANVEDLPQDFVMLDLEALIGREVVDSELGSLGTIEEVMVGPANDVWVIDGPFGEVLLPVVDEVVSDVANTGPILVRAPKGSVRHTGGELS